MAIQFISVKCPECAANLEVENGRAFTYCSYCGTKVMINNDNEHIYRTIDEAGIRQAETERLIRLKELELESQEQSRKRKGTLLAYGIALGFVLIGALICIGKPLAGMWGIMIGAYIALFTYIKSDDKKKKERRYVGANEVSITDPMTCCVEKDFHSAVMLFRGAGFANVTAVSLNDLNVFNMKKNGQVECVTINGNDEFEVGDVVPKNANILITYHGK